jgi:Na+-translocating ferredoxin:NAD+ oxidoreductase RnfG subunit
MKKLLVGLTLIGLLSVSSFGMTPGFGDKMHRNHHNRETTTKENGDKVVVNNRNDSRVEKTYRNNKKIKTERIYNSGKMKTKDHDKMNNNKRM